MRAAQALDDPPISVVCRIMQAYACAFIIVFLFFFAAMLFHDPQETGWSLKTKKGQKRATDA
jgi:hypothetical protein